MDSINVNGSKIEVFVEIYTNIYTDNDKVLVENALFVNDADDPSLTKVDDFSVLLDSFIEHNSIPGGTVTEEYRKEMLDLLNKMKEVVEEKIDVVNKMPQWKKQKPNNI